MKSSASTGNRRSLLMSTARVAPAEDDVIISSEDESNSNTASSLLPGSKRTSTSTASSKKKSSQRRLVGQTDGDSDQEQDKPKLSLSAHVPSNRRFSANSHNIKTSLMLSNHRRASAPVNGDYSANHIDNDAIEPVDVPKPSSKREQRRRSVLQSLAALDIDDDDLSTSLDQALPPPSYARSSSFDSDDGLLDKASQSSSRAANAPPSLASLPRRSAHNASSSGDPPRPLPKRYLRRGGVTHTQKYDDTVTHNQPIAPNVSHGDDSDYGSDVGSTSRRHRPAATSTRYLRRGSVTKHHLNPQVSGMQPTASSLNVGDESDYGSDYDFINPNTTDIVSDAYMSESGMDDDIYSNDEDDLRTALQKAQRNAAPPLTKRGKKRQYLRRGSVTKYSLDAGNATTIQTDSQTSQAEQDARYIAKSRLPPPPSNDDYSPRFSHANIAPSVASAAASATSQDEDMDFYSTNLEDSKRPMSSRSVQISSSEDERAGSDLQDESDTSDREEDAKKLPAKVSRTKPRSKRHLKSATPASPRQDLPPLARKKKASKALENDSGHVRKTWYKDPSSPSKTSKTPVSSSLSSPNGAVKQESTSSMESSDPSESSEFATEESASSPQKQTISEDRNVGEATPCSIKQRKSVAKDTPPAKSLSVPKKFPTMPPPLSKRNSSGGSKMSPPPKKDTSVSSKVGSGKPPPRAKSLTKEKRASTGSSNVKSPPPTAGSGKNDKGKASKLRSKSLDNMAPILPLLPKSCLKKTSSKNKGLASSIHSEPDGKKVAKKVRFGKLVITEFPIILGDNPAVTSGAPVTIDWTPQDQRTLSVTAYEQTKPRRRRRRKLLISVSQRAILLLAAGYTIDDIADASINAQQIKQSRQQAIDNQQWDRVNLMMEHTGGALGRLLQQPFQSTSKKLKALIVKPTQQTASARMA